MDKKKRGSIVKEILMLIVVVASIVAHIWFSWDKWNIKRILLVAVPLLLVILCFTGIVRDLRDAKMPVDEKEFVQGQRRMKMFEQRRMSKQMPGKQRKNMYVDVYLKATAQELLAFILVSLMFLLLIGSKMEELAKALEFEPYEGFVVFGIIDVLCLAGWLISTYFTGAVPKLKKEIERKGYDEEAVKRDYSRGNFFSVQMGVLNIGSTFVIYARRRECCVVLVESIRSVQRVYFCERVNGVKADHYIVRMYTDTGMVPMWSDDIGVDLIIEEFRKRGIAVREGNLGRGLLS